jgi:type VI protein secretion system component Hcp
MSAVDYFLKIDGIKGESQDSKHGGEIEIQSFSWGATQSLVGCHAKREFRPKAAVAVPVK